jgi:hypothetical protein
MDSEGFVQWIENAMWQGLHNRDPNLIFKEQKKNVMCVKTGAPNMHVHIKLEVKPIDIHG